MTSMKSDNLTPWGEPAYYSSLEGSLAIMRELMAMKAEETYLKWFQSHAPAVRLQLEKMGVDFSKAKVKTQEPRREQR